MKGVRKLHDGNGRMPKVCNCEEECGGMLRGYMYFLQDIRRGMEGYLFLEEILGDGGYWGGGVGISFGCFGGGWRVRCCCGVGRAGFVAWSMELAVRPIEHFLLGLQQPRR